jgi:hypothetical protein
MGINVHNIRGGESGQIKFVPITSETLKTINITWNGGHYEPHVI